MIRGLQLPTIKRTSGGLVILFLGAFLMYNLHYLNIHDLYFWIGLISLPLTYRIKKEERSHRFFWLAAGFALFVLPFPITFGLYCMLIFSILFIIEQLEGKTNFLFTLHLLLLSPLFQYFNSLVSFPIRLALSGTAAHLLQYAGFEVAVSGNLIQMEGVDFLVDSACSGLFMLRYSFLFAILILARFQHQESPWNGKEVSLLLMALFLFNILGNLIRIVMLIVFKIMPEFWFHGFLGLIIFILYSILPFYFLVSFWAKKKKNRAAIPYKNFPGIPPLFPLAIALLFLSLTIASWRNSCRLEKEISLNTATTAAYQVEKGKDNVYKLSTDNALIYLKPPVEAYHADHNPLICWKGSGYEFKHISTTSIGKLEVSVAELIKGNDKLYTMWWFDSGNYQTGSQWDWRWRSLSKKEDFYLVNITAANMETLQTEARAFLSRHKKTWQ